MNIKVKGSEWLNERGNRSYNSNYVFPKDSTTKGDLYVVCGAVGAGVMYRGEQVAEQVVTELVDYIAQHAANFESEADSQAELITSALAHAEKALAEYVILHPECHGIATTLACVHFTQKGAIVGWVGDTRTVLLRNGMLVRQTADHSTKYPYDDFSLHPRRSINRMVEGSDKAASMDVEWWSDLQPNDVIVLGTYAVMRPLEQGFLADAWEREPMRDGLKFACDAHARDNYAIYTIRMGEGVVQTVNAEDTLAAIGAAPLSLAAVHTMLQDEEDETAPSLESETAPLETETAPLETEISAPTLETETADIEAVETVKTQEDLPTLESETAAIEGSSEVEEVKTQEDAPTLESETAAIEGINEIEIVEEINAQDVLENDPTLESETAAIEEIETPKKPLIGGNYAYDEDEDEDEKAGTGFIWSPTQTTTTSEVTDVEHDAIPTNPIATDENPIIPIIPIIMDNNAADKKDDKNIVDFTPVTDKDKQQQATVTKGNDSTVGRWGWAIAACLVGIAILAWLGSFMFGTNERNDKTAETMRLMQQDLYVAKNAADSLSVYNNYLAKAKNGTIQADSLAKIEAYARAIESSMNATAQSDTTGLSKLAQNTSQNEPTTKQAVTEAGVKTNAKPQLAQNAVSANNGGDKPASDATAPAASPKKETEENKVAGSVQPKAKLISTKPPVGTPPGPVMQGRQSRPTSYAAPTTLAAATPKTDVWKTYDKAWAASEGFRVVKKGSKWGWMHEDGKPFVGLNYDEVGSFKDGLAPLKKGSKWGFTNKDGKIVVGYNFVSINAFGASCPGLAKVNDGKRVYFINKLGKETPACK